MALSQVQIIQSLGEALAWFEKELSWGVEPAELRHLTGRIGELYAAMITRGQMALDTNQRGYDVISSDNERISVKTITSSTHVSIKGSTFSDVDRVMVLRLNIDDDDGVSIECLDDIRAPDVEAALVKTQDGYRYNPSRRAQIKPLENLRVSAEAPHGDLIVKQYESGTMQVLRAGVALSPAKPHLREIARSLGIDLLSESGTEKNTRHLGANIIKQLRR